LVKFIKGGVVIRPINKEIKTAKLDLILLHGRLTQEPQMLKKIINLSK
jgi:hypothetical protein